jgi:hypothetical protein
VASSRTKSKNRRTSRQILMAGARSYDPQPLTVPTWWLNTVIAIFLLPVAVLLTQSLFTCFHQAAVDHRFWATQEFRFFTLGSAAWVAIFFAGMWAFGEPRPLRVYVFGHELTHAIWVWAMGGKVMRFKVRRDGGHIITDTNNFLVALAPYFYPLYSLAVIAVYGVASVFYNMAPFTPLLFGLLGLTWAFHISFTLWMIPKGQSDLTYHGTVFSLVVIYVMNLLLLLALLIIAAPEVTLAAFVRELLAHAEEMSVWLWSGLRWLVRGA